MYSGPIYDGFYEKVLENGKVIRHKCLFGKRGNAVMEKQGYKFISQWDFDNPKTEKKAGDPSRGKTKRKIQAFVERLKQKGYSQEKIVRILLKNKKSALKKGKPKLVKNIRSYLRRLDYKRYI